MIQNSYKEEERVSHPVLWAVDLRLQRRWFLLTNPTFQVVVDRLNEIFTRSKHLWHHRHTFLIHMLPHHTPFRREIHMLVDHHLILLLPILTLVPRDITPTTTHLAVDSRIVQYHHCHHRRLPHRPIPYLLLRLPKTLIMKLNVVISETNDIHHVCPLQTSLIIQVTMMLIIEEPTHLDENHITKTTPDLHRTMRIPIDPLRIKSGIVRITRLRQDIILRLLILFLHQLRRTVNRSMANHLKCQSEQTCSIPNRHRNKPVHLLRQV